MLATYGIAAGRTRAAKLANFLIAFGVWDLFYYVWLRIVLDWPASLFTWDVLFLIPVPWVGPVVAPVSVACTMIAMGLVLLRLDQSERHTGGGTPSLGGPGSGLPHRHRVFHDRRSAAAAGPRRPAEQLDSDDLPLVDAGPWTGTGHWDVRRMGEAGLPSVVTLAGNRYAR